MEEPRGAPRLARRGGEAERPRDAVPAALDLAAADVVAQLTGSEADRETLRRAGVIVLRAEDVLHRDRRLGRPRVEGRRPERGTRDARLQPGRGREGGVAEPPPPPGPGLEHDQEPDLEEPGLAAP